MLDEEVSPDRAHDLRIRTVIPSGPRWGAALALLAGSLVSAGLLCVDDGFTRRYRACDLRGNAGCISDPSTVEPSDIGLLRWRSGVHLEVFLGPVEPGDVVKLKLCSPGGPQRVALTVDDTPVADLEVGTTWRQLEVVTPTGGSRIRLDRHDPAGNGVDLSRLSVANTVGHASGAFEVAVRSRLARPILRRVDPISRAVVLALPPLLLGLLLALDRGRRQTWPASCRRAVAMLAPSAALLTFSAGSGLISPWFITFPGRTFPLLVLIPAAVSLAVRNRTALAALLCRAASLPVWSRPRSLAARAFRPDGWSSAITRWVAVAALTLFALAAILLLPLSPFEWDEVLFLRAIDQYDVAQHSPHPPGYPLYVAAGQLLNTVVADPVRSLQLVSVLGSLLALAGVGLTLRRLAAPRGSVAVASVLLATTPAFAFHANVGMSDALATGLATLSLWTCAAVVSARRESHWLVAAAGLAALALAARPQVGALLVGPGLWVIARTLRRRQWRPVVAATVTGIGLSVACWLPAVVITGWPRYIDACRSSFEWISRNEVGGHLPAAPLGRLLDAWLVQPFGSATLAVAFWILVFVGGVAWWRSNRRQVVGLATLAGGGYLLFAALRLDLDASVRYVGPALPCLAMLAGGVLMIRRPVPRAGLAAAAAVLALLQVGWAAPAYLLRAREEAPVWATLGWVRATVDPATTQLVFTRVIRAHTQYLLSDHRVLALQEDDARVGRLPGPRVWLIGSLYGLRNDHLVHSVAWRSDHLQRLTRNRYLDCGVAQRGGSPPVLFGEPLPVGPWPLTTARTVRRAAIDGSFSIRVEPLLGTVEIRRGERPLVSVTVGAVAELPLPPGERGSLQLVPVDPVVTLTTALVTGGVGWPPEPRSYLPSAAHVVGGDDQWRSDLELVNTTAQPASCGLSLIPGDHDGATPARVLLPVPPGGRLLLPDVVGLLFGVEGSGAIAIESGPPGVRLRSTMYRTVPGSERHSADIPAASAGDMLDQRHPGTATLPTLGRGGGDRVNLGVVNPCDHAVVMVAMIGQGAQIRAEARRILVGPRSYRVLGLGTIDRPSGIEVAVETPGTRVLAHAAVIDDGTARWTFVPILPTAARH